MKIEKENVIKKIVFNNNLEFELGELNRNEESDYYLELCINIVKNVDNNYSIEVETYRHQKIYQTLLED